MSIKDPIHQPPGPLPQVPVVSIPQLSITLDSPEWAAKNARRMVLIRKKNREGLDPTEKAEFEQLQEMARALVEAASPPPELFAPEIDAIIARKAAP